MKTVKWIPSLLSAVIAVAPSARAQTLSTRLQKVCEAKRAEYRDRFIDCKEGFDSGITPASASYQPTNIGANVSSREAVNYYWYGGKDTYTNPFPEIKGMRKYLDGKVSFGVDDPSKQKALKKKPVDPQGDECLSIIHKPLAPKPALAAGQERIERGYPLGYRMRDLVEKRFGENSSLHQWFKNTWIPTQSAEEQNEAEGSCHMWAPWSMDRKVLSSLKNVHSGILCEGIPLSLGEIKEIYYQLYGAAGGGRNPTREQSSAFFVGDEEQEHLFEGSLVKKAMDANLALERLGALGGAVEGDGLGREGLDPSTVLAKFRNAIQSGKTFTFDRDHGAQMWNQPAAAMVVTRYRGDTSAADLLSTTDYSAVGDDESLTQLQNLEKSLIVGLSAGQGLEGADQAQLERLAGRSLTEGAALDEYAKLVSEAKARLLKQGKIAPKNASGALRVIQQDLTVIYGEENTYASMGPDRQAQRSFRFASVVDASGKQIKSTWTPSKGKLSDLCRRPDPEFTGFSGWSGPYECCKLAKGRVDDYPVFTSAVPPRHIDIFDELDPDIDDPGAEAYIQFQIMLLGESAFKDPVKKAEAIKKYGLLKPACPSFDRAARFTALFRARRDDPKHTISDADREQLLELFDQAEFLDDRWVKEVFCKTSGVTGFTELKSALNAKRAGFCP